MRNEMIEWVFEVKMESRKKNKVNFGGVISVDILYI